MSFPPGNQSSPSSVHTPSSHHNANLAGQTGSRPVRRFDSDQLNDMMGEIFNKDCPFYRKLEIYLILTEYGASLQDTNNPEHDQEFGRKMIGCLRDMLYQNQLKLGVTDEDVSQALSGEWKKKSAAAKEAAEFDDKDVEMADQELIEHVAQSAADQDDDDNDDKDEEEDEDEEEHRANTPKGMGAGAASVRTTGTQTHTSPVVAHVIPFAFIEDIVARCILELQLLFSSTEPIPSAKSAGSIGDGRAGASNGNGGVKYDRLGASEATQIAARIRDHPGKVLGSFERLQAQHHRHHDHDHDHDHDRDIPSAGEGGIKTLRSPAKGEENGRLPRTPGSAQAKVAGRKRLRGGEFVQGREEDEEEDEEEAKEEYEDVFAN